MCGIIVALPGLSEFGEKYIETARDCINKGYGFYVIDWAYQGRSTRLEDTPHRRSSDGYDADISDLDYLITNIIKPTTPLFMLAHSMGGNIGLQYLIKYKDIFQAASFSAPMFGIKALKNKEMLAQPIAALISQFGNLYIPFGQDWHEGARKSNGEDIFSSDPKRDSVHNAWCLANPGLQVGNPTYRWINESLKSIIDLKNRQDFSMVSMPLLFSYVELEELVDNDAIQYIGTKIPNAELMEIKKAKHEILMETDNIRKKFLDRTFSLFKNTL